MDASDAELDDRSGGPAREVRRGWRLGDELLRPAQVIVAKAAGLELGESWR